MNPFDIVALMMLIDGMEYVYAVPSQAFKQEQAVRRRWIVGAGSEGGFLDELGESRALAHVGPLVNKPPSPLSAPENSHSVFHFFLET